MRRLFWVALGATAGVLVVRRVSRTASAYTPAGLRRGLERVSADLRSLTAEVQVAMREREAELREALGIDGDRNITGESNIEGEPNIEGAPDIGGGHGGGAGRTLAPAQAADLVVAPAADGKHRA